MRRRNSGLPFDKDELQTIKYREMWEVRYHREKGFHVISIL